MASRLVAFMALALTALMLTGCSSSHEPSDGGAPPNGDEPPNGDPATDPITIVLTVYRAEWEADSIFMGVGEYATLQVEPMTKEGCPSDVPCPFTGDSVTIRSSNPDVLEARRELRLVLPTRASLIGRAPGTAVLSLTVGGHTESRQVTVGYPPPLDSLHVEVVTEWEDLPAQYDASHNLTWVELPGGDYRPFRVRGFRGGREIFGNPIYVYVSRSASSPMILDQPAIGCRPGREDVNCRVVHDFWLRGLNPGDDQVTVYGRGTSAHFTVHVPCEGIRLDCPVAQTSRAGRSP